MGSFVKAATCLALTLCLVGCNKPGTGATEGAIKIDLNAPPCGPDDPACLNERLVRRMDEDEKLFGRFDPKLAFGEWRVVAALERTNPKSLRGQQPFVQIFELRPVWAGSKVHIARDVIWLEPPADAPVSHPERSKSGALYPKCTAPTFETDLRRSASATEEYINPWQNFGLQFERMGRYMFVLCHGALEYPDDGLGDVAEVTVEEAESLGAIYIQSPELLIAEWGSLQLLLQREGT